MVYKLKSSFIIVFETFSGSFVSSFSSPAGSTLGQLNKAGRDRWENRFLNKWEDAPFPNDRQELHEGFVDEHDGDVDTVGEEEDSALEQTQLPVPGEADEHDDGGGVEDGVAGEGSPVDVEGLQGQGRGEGDDDEQVEDGRAHNGAHPDVTLEGDSRDTREQLGCRGA